MPNAEGNIYLIVQKNIRSFPKWDTLGGPIETIGAFKAAVPVF